MNTIILLLIPLLIQIESGGDPFATGDNGNSVGILQISKIFVDDVNRILGEDVYKYIDRNNVDKSKAMVKVYLSHYAPDMEGLSELDKLCILGSIHCGGPRGYLKACTVPYRVKIIELYNEVNK